MPLKEQFFSLLIPYQNQIESDISQSIENDFGPPSSLRDACEYALKNGGKRFRPALVHLIAAALRKGNSVSQGALAVEFFHTASLIADDLPCMDDEKIRRSRPALHLAFGESTAILTTYALISAGYEKIRRNALDGSLLSSALESASHTTGILGATGGQFSDLFPPSLDEDKLRTIIYQKTGTLFELSFVFGWIFGGGEHALLPTVKKAAGHFGMAFQIVDDFDDLEKDKAEGRTLNYPALVGEEKASQVLFEELDYLAREMKKLQLVSPELLAMSDFLKESAYSVSISSS